MSAPNGTRALLPSWLIDERRKRWAWVLWGLVFAFFTIVSIVRPGLREVLHVYRRATLAWLAGEEIYPLIDYPPPFVILFTPFAKMPQTAAEILWRALGMGIFVSGLWRMARMIEPAGRLFFFVTLLTIQASFGSIKNGQTNLMLAGAMAHATVEWAGSRRPACAGWLTIATLAKPVAIVMVLLVAAADLALIPWIAGGLALAGAIPLFFDSWPRVVHHYRAWFADLGLMARWDENRFDDLAGLFRTLHVEVSTATMFRARVLSAVLTLVVFLAAGKRLGRTPRALMLLSLSATYLMLFNPRTESNGYVILSTAIAGHAAWLLFVEGRRLGWLLVGLEAGMWNGSLGWHVWMATKLWLMPVLAVGYFGFLLFEAGRIFRRPPERLVEG